MNIEKKYTEELYKKVLNDSESHYVSLSLND